jgi:hypothetical protein
MNCLIPETGTDEQEFLRNTEPLVLATFTAIWKAIQKTDISGGHLIYTAVGFPLSEEDAAVVEARERNALLSKVRNASGATVKVLHLDEMQLFCDFPLAWERCRDKRRVTAKDLAQYKQHHTQKAIDRVLYICILLNCWVELALLMVLNFIFPKLTRNCLR